jgi:PiT family inorganic phosphate transporter
VTVVAVLAALGLAVALGAGDAPNATATLVATKLGRPAQVTALSFVSHLAGGLLGGTAVARTITSILDLPANEVAEAYAGACLAAVAFMALCAWAGIPASASYGLIGGLVGAGVVAEGWDAIDWGGVEGLRPVGVIGALVGLLLTPIAGVAVAAALRASLVRGLRRGSQRLRPATDAGLWATAATVGFAGGSNDGQKSMGLIVGAIVAAGWIDDDGGIPFGIRAVVAVALASATVLAGRRIAITVGRRFYRVRPIEGLAAQSAAAAVILASGAVGAPVSTSNVVTAGVIGVGADHRPRHVRWLRVYEVGGAWALSVPACGVLGALVTWALRLV